MSSPAVLPSLFSSLPERPPTPPRETHHEAASAIKASLGSVDTRLSVHTPPGFQSPAASSATASTSRRIRKKVGFSAQAEYKEAPVYTDTDGVQQNPTPVSLPRSASKPVKSILKPTLPSPNLLGPAAAGGSDPSNPPVNLVTMLESTLQQLAGGDRDSKLDAYLMMTRAWKASDNLPDRVALQEKMGLFTQFMQRDIVAKTAEGNLDSSLVNHALNLLNTFLHFPAIASTISNDFAIFVIDHCIRCFEEPCTPKDTARRLMHVISRQNFSSKIMTSDRVGRLVSSLHNIEEHLKGKSIVLSRVLVYRKLVQQSRQLMIIHSDWLLDMFTDMLSSLKDIRSAAIALGLEAAFGLGHERQLSRKVMEIFNLAYEDRRYIQYYEEKLKAMSKDKHQSVVVPQIWSVVILLLRIRLDKWEFAGPWLQIIQKCFNSVDFPTRIAANHAWGRLVYLMHTEERGLRTNLATLTTPLISQLRQKGSRKTSEELRRAVLGGICNLFYYIFKPNTPSTILDMYWDAVIRPILAQLLDPTAEAAEHNLHQASAILGGLFDCTTPRRWRVDHIVESPLVKPEELPPIDSKWIRHNASRVFGVVEPILELDFLALARADSPAHHLWRALISTVASAAAKEIKVSRDTAVFVAGALGVLDRIWKRGVVGEGDTERNVTEFLLAARAYLETMIGLLGLLPFTGRTGKSQPPAKAPLSTLFSVLSTLPPGVPDDKHFADFFASVFGPFFASRGDKARMDLAQELMSIIPMEAPRPYGAWLLVAENISGGLGPEHHSHRSTSSAGETPVGHDYRDIVKVLERGIRSTPNLPPKHWESLLYATLERVREETGDAGVAIVVIEPLAKVLAEQFTAPGAVENPSACVKYVCELVSVATQPRDRHAVDSARKRLWGTILAGSRSSSFDTFDNLYKAVNEVLGYLYTSSDPIDSDSAVRLFKEIGSFFDRCNRQLFLRAMVSLQDGLLVWFQDSKRLLGGQTPSVLAAMKLVWDKLANLISDMEHPEQQLQCLERFFCASLSSCHRSIVNSTIALWNKLFENIEQLEYPEELKTALVQMQLQADIALPGLEVSSVECAAQQTTFIDSFEDFSLPRLPSAHFSSGTPRPNSAQSKTPTSVKLTGEQADKVFNLKPVSANLQNTRPRLRHDDSQIQFAAIEPSAPSSPLESQFLTERQKEVRDRQRENMVLFPEIRSCSGITTREPARQMPPVSPQAQQAATPERERRFDDYISSTPTPRRGQLVVIAEHDLTDPPSSPPELRGNPLAAEIRSRSASHSLLDEWQFSSSPVSGSPNPSRHGVVPDASSQRGWASVVCLPEVNDEAEVPSSPVNEEAMKEPELAMDEVIEDSMIFEVPEAARPPEQSGKPANRAPSTPRRSARLSQAQAHQTPTPKSEVKEFVDAPTSPLPQTPTRQKETAEEPKLPGAEQAHAVRANNATTYFDGSDISESALLQLVVALDSGKADRAEYHRLSVSVSPEKDKRSPPVIDCIVVKESPKKSEQPVPARITRSASAASTVSSAIEPPSAPGSQRRPRAGRLKRKRTLSKVQDSSPKRQRHDSGEDRTGAVDSQAPPAQDGSVEIHASSEVQTTILEGVSNGEAHEERIPSSSVEHSASQPSGDSVPADSAILGADAMEVEENDEDVQSQIALELSHSQHQAGASTSASEENSATPGSPEDLTGICIPQPGTDNVGGNEAAAHAEEPIRNGEEAVAAETPPAQKIMESFRRGLDELRLARLSREEVYQIEDMFMDMRRELIEAERRGRTLG